MRNRRKKIKKYSEIVAFRLSKGTFQNLELMARKKRIGVSELVRNLLSGVIGILLFLFLAQPCIAETASWYSVESCKREGTWQKYGGLMANGKIFDDTKLTCAMWGVPFGSRFRVTNVSNGKSVVVTVSDRGPSKRLVNQGRIVDLAKSAFSKIADLKQGVISVRIEKL